MNLPNWRVLFFIVSAALALSCLESVLHTVAACESSHLSVSQFLVEVAVANFLAVPLLILSGIAAEVWGRLRILQALQFSAAVTVFILGFTFWDFAVSVTLSSILRAVLLPATAGILSVFATESVIVESRVLMLLALVGLGLVSNLLVGLSLGQSSSELVIIVGSIVASLVPVVEAKLAKLKDTRSEGLVARGVVAEARVESFELTMFLSHLLALVAVLVSVGILPLFDAAVHDLVGGKVALFLSALMGVTGLSFVSIWNVWGWGWKWFSPRLAPIVLVSVATVGVFFLMPAGTTPEDHSGVVVVGWLLARLALPSLNACVLLVGMSVVPAHRRAVGAVYLLAVEQVLGTIVGAIFSATKEHEAWYHIATAVLVVCCLSVAWVHRKLRSARKGLSALNTPRNTPKASRAATPRNKADQTPTSNIRDKKNTVQNTRQPTISPARAPSPSRSPIRACPVYTPILLDV